MPSTENFKRLQAQFLGDKISRNLIESLFEAVGDVFKTLEPELLFVFICEKLESSWSAEHRLQLKLASEAKQGTLPTEKKLSELYLPLVTDVSKALGLLYQIEAKLEKKRLSGQESVISQTDIETMITVATSWFNSLRSPRVLEPEVLEAHQRLTFKDRVQAFVEIEKEAGAKIPV